MSSEAVEIGQAAFLIYVPPGSFTGDALHLNEFISQNKFTKTWWNFIPNLYVITSNSSKNEIKASLRRFMGDAGSFIVARVDPNDFGGFLKAGGWEAFRKDIRGISDIDVGENT